MADIHEDITGDSSSLVQALNEGTEAAEPLAEALKQIRDALAALEGASEGLEEADEQLDSARDKAAQAAETVDDLQAAFDALVASGPPLGDIGDFLDTDAEAAAAFRDRVTEAAQAEVEATTAAAGLDAPVAPLEADAAAAGHLRDNLAEAKIEAGGFKSAMATLAGELITNDPGQMFAVSMNEAGKISVKSMEEALGASMVQLEQALSSAGSLELAQQFLAAGQAAGTWETSLDGLDDAVKDANSLIATQTGALDDLAASGGNFTQSVQAEVAAMQEFRAAFQAWQATGSVDDFARLTAASDALDARLSAASAAGEDFRDAFGDVDSVTRDVASSLKDADPVFGDAEEGIYALRQSISDLGSTGGVGFVSGIFSGWRDLLTGVKDAAEDTGPGLLNLGADVEGLGEAFSGTGEAISSAIGPLTSSVLPAAIAGLVGTVVAAAPGLVAVGAGFISFGAMALPVLDEVKNGLSSVSSAQQAYNMAAAVEARNPTKDNLADQQKALATLRSTWAQMPAPVSEAVRAVQQFQAAWDATAKSSGIQNDALKDITGMLGDAKTAIPDIKQLAESAAPVISSMWTDIGKNLKSSDWQSFIDSVNKDVPSAANAFHNLAGGVGDFLADLQEKGAGAGNQFINSLAALMKTTAGPGSTGLINAVNAMSRLMQDANDIASNNTVKTLFDLLGGVTGTEAGQSVASAANINRGIALGNAGLLGSSGYVGSEPTAKQAAEARSRAEAEGRQQAQAFRQGLDTLGPMDLRAKFAPINTSDLRRSLETAGPMDIQAKITHIDTTALKRSLSEDNGPDVPEVHAKVQTSTSTSDLQKQVDDTAKNVKIHGVEVDLADAKLSGLAALQPILTQAGKAAGQDFVTAVITAITAGDARGEATARQLAAGIRAGMSALAGQMRAIGQDADQGLAQGISADQGAAVSAARNLAAAVEAAARVHLQTQSPSKVFEDIGKETVAGFVIGLEGGKSAVQTAIDDVLDQAKPFNDSTITAMITKMRDEVEAAAKAGVISTSTESTYSKWLTSDNQRLQSLAQRRSEIEQQISAADTMAADVSGGVRSSALVANAYGMTYQGQAATTPVYSSITAALKGQLEQTLEFRKDIEKLKKEGLSGAQIGDILDQGVSGGLPIAQQILSGGKAGIKQINELEKEIAAAGKALGITGANASYESGSEMGKGLAAGLRSELKTIDNEMKRVADELVDAIKRALRISSPSGVMMDIGGQIGEGLIAGMEAKRAAITAAGERMSASATGYLPSRGYGGGGFGGDMPPIEIHLTSVSTLDGKQVARSTQKYTLQKARRNTRSGLQLPGRGT